MNPLKNPWYSALAGLVLALILAAILSTGSGNAIEWTVWLHVVVGIMWIGLLYYFNFVQVPAVNAAVADGDPGPAAINKYVAPKALWFFRWAALLTWLTGVSGLAQIGGGPAGIINAFTFQGGMAVIGMGAWLGTIMLFNVWVLIWPNQKKLLGFTPASDEEKAKAKIVALYASRTNTLLSIPMLLGMTGYAHGLPF
jgi:uncharacterized membrane protein